MSFGSRFVRLYFDHVYNPVYDFAVGHLNHYNELQKHCAGKLKLEGNEMVLCAGLGTGNEICHLLECSPTARITGVDFSNSALKKARAKAVEAGKRIETCEMDIHRLALPSGAYDRVMCLHVMDFVPDKKAATRELLRVLKDGGRFVITYPSEAENLRLGRGLLKDAVRHNRKIGKSRAMAVLDPLVRMAAGMVFLPLLFRPGRRTCRREELRSLLSEVTGEFSIEEETLYHDYIVFGMKHLQKQ